MSNEPKWVTIATFATLMNAQLAKGRLESEGIEVFLKNEFTVSLASYLSSAVRVELQVKETDVEQACAILQEKNPS